MNEPNFYPTPRCTSMCGGTGSFEKVRELRRGGTSRTTRQRP